MENPGGQDEQDTVELWYAPLPKPLTAIAWHHYFVVRRGTTNTTKTTDRYEVWQTKNAGGESAGHVHKNLMGAERGVGGGAAVRVREWTGAEAERLARVLDAAFANYPHRERYLVFPGPNSNTFVGWVLSEAGVRHRLDWRGIGRWF